MNDGRGETTTGFPETHNTAVEALQHADSGRDKHIHAGLLHMLRTGSNPNPALADGLNLAPRYYLGPVTLELAHIPRCCGPEPHMVYHDPQPNWDRHISEMVQAIKTGWEPPPLLFCAGGHLMDGNHRHGALTQAGRTSHPTILMFDSAQARERWVQENLPVTEVPLTGGHTTSGIVKVGQTVRRPHKPAHEFRNTLLKWLEDRGFAGAPRHLGTDEQGRDIFDWIEGYILPRELMYTAEQIHAGARMLANLHQVTATYPGTGNGTVVLHGDAKPRNMVFSGPNGWPVALIDFDNATIGTPAGEQAWFTWTFALRSTRTEQYPPETQARNFRAAADGFCTTTRACENLLEAVMNLQHAHLSAAKNKILTAPTADRTHLAANLEWLEQETAWTTKIHKQLRAACTT